MPDLPHGWRMRNSNVDLAGPPIEEDGFAVRREGDDDDDDDRSGPLDIKPDSEGWEDMEDDTEVVSIKCLLCPKVFPGARTMVQHGKDDHDFDFVQIQKQHGLEFYESIKLVNYLRKAVSEGAAKPPTDDKTAWSGDEFLVPFLEDDALLFSLDDLDDDPVLEPGNGKDPENA